MRYFRMKRLLSFFMAVAMVLSLGVNGAYAVESGATIERLDPSEVTADLLRPGLTVTEKNDFSNTHAETESVRVIIVLEKNPAISLFSNMESGIANGDDIAEYREELEYLQQMMADYISEEALNGRKMEIVSSLTLVTNAFSAVVRYGDIDAIRNTEGVASVFIEPVFVPLKAETNNIISQEMTGASVVQNSGYTGAGRRIAVIDTGTDTDHQSFDVDGFEYSLAELAEEKGMSYDEYVASLDLLTVEDIEAVLTQLNAYKASYGEYTAEDFYLNSKQPFAFNYIDRDLDVANDVDGIVAHGSHVAGIAAANRYIECGKVYDFDGNGSFDEQDVQAVMDFVMGGAVVENHEMADVSLDGTVTTYDVHLLAKALAEHKAGGHYISAADSVLVTGSAPDAQLITMKVFGKNGGAYASDYMAAVEDAILLGCDVVNLSLGTNSPGFAEPHYDEETYIGWNDMVNRVMERVTDTGIVMSVSAGNSYSWSYFDLWNPEDTGYGMLYTDEGGVSTIAEPATYANSLAVASVDNAGEIGSFELIINGANAETGLRLNPAESAGDGPKPWTSLDSIDAGREGTEYEIVFLGDPTGLLTGGTQTDTTIYAGSLSDFDGYDFTGKVVLVARGNDVFFNDKYYNASLAGAAAVLIYNNESSTLYVDFSEAGTDIPVGILSLEEAQEIFGMFAKNSDGLYSGTFTVYNRRNVTMNGAGSPLEMSIFSSWGPTGDLTIKPEITAPGGAIYSINGNDPSGAAYELMSGTSMAAPHLSGLAALLSQHFEENGVLAKTGMSARHLAHSLLMSTAVPVIEAESGVEYSVRSQGAGLASVEKAVLSNAYITVAGQTDGKVKAELGDGTGDRTVTFTITNFGDSALTYDLSASILTTATFYTEGNYYISDSMTRLPVDIDFTQNSVTVAAGQSATVAATISVPAETVAAMESMGYVNGFYLEGFIYIDPVADSEGAVDAAHSIPLLGWYGDWSDPSMYDKGSFMDYVDGATAKPGHVFAPYKNMLSWLPAGYTEAVPYTGNLYGGMTQDKTTGEVYMVGDQRYIEARNAISSDPNHWWELYGILPTLIRNAGDVYFKIADAVTGEIYCEDDFEELDDTFIASYFLPSEEQWWNSGDYYVVGPDEWKVTDADGNPLAEDTEFIVTLSTAPEYCVREDGTVDWSSMGKGTDLNFRFRVDNTYPELVDFTCENGVVNFEFKDNNYIAAVILLNGAANRTLDYFYPDMDERGGSVVSSFNLADYNYMDKKVAIAVCDYAGNESYFAINLGGEGVSYGELVGFQYDAGSLFEAPGAPTWSAIDLEQDAQGKEIVKDEFAIFTSTTEFVCAEYVNGHVYAQDASGKFYGIPYEDMLANSVDLEECYLGTLNKVYNDLSYNYCFETLYGLYVYEDERQVTSEIYAISLTSGYMGDAYTDSEWPDYEANSIYGLALAFDDFGNPFVMGMGVTFDYDQTTGKTITVLSDTAHLWSYASVKVGTMWISKFLDLGDTGMKMDFLQSMTFNHNSDSEFEELYWARFYYDGNLGSAMEKELVKIDVSGLYADEWGAINAEGTFTCEVVGQLSKETCGLFVPLTEEARWEEPHFYVPEFDPEMFAKPVLNVESLTMSVGDTAQLSCTFDPWYSNYTNVEWESSDTNVAIVDEYGMVTAVGNGACSITVYTLDDMGYRWRSDVCSVNVASLSLSINGTITTAAGINAVTNARLYNYSIVDGKVTYTDGVSITADGDFAGYGLMLGAAVQGKNDELWVTEWGNSGMFYQVNPTTGEVVEMSAPIGGNHTFGMSYSEATGYYTTISNNNIFVDVNLPLTEDDLAEMMPEEGEDGVVDGSRLYDWHRLDMLPYLLKSGGNFVTGEFGNGASSEIVFCGITDIDSTYVPDFNAPYGPEYQYVGVQPFFEDDYSYGYANYTPDTTHVLMDNVGRLWYIDEICNMVYEDGAYSKMQDGFYDPMSVMAEGECGIMSMENRDGTYNVFVIRDVVETGLTDMFREGTMPRISYNFSDIYYAGEIEVWGGYVEEIDMETWEYVQVYKTYTAPVFYMSLYDHWNSGVENELYLYIPGVETEAWDDMTGGFIKTNELLMKLGTTGEGNIIATITSATPAEDIVGLPFNVSEPSGQEAGMLTAQGAVSSVVTHFIFER